MKPFKRIKIDKIKPTIKGKMIFFDGPDGSGKSTQMDEVADYLEGKGYKVKKLRQPGMPGEHGDNIRKALFGEDRYRNFWAIRLLFVAEYLEFMERYAHCEDEVILCDRSVLISNTCIGGAEYDLYDLLDIMDPLYNLAEKLPDSILIYSVTPETVKKRLQSRYDEGGEINYYDKKPEWFHVKSCKYYDKMEEMDDNHPNMLGLSSTKKTIYTIDANKDVKSVTESTINLLNDLYEI